MSARIELTAIPPFRLDATVRVLQRVVNNPVDRFEGGRYWRVLPTVDGPRLSVVEQQGPIDDPQLSAAIEGGELSQGGLGDVEKGLRWLLALDVDLSDFYRLAEADDQLGPVARALYGMKPPRFPSLFETLVNAIACQQVSLEAGLSIMGRFAERFGQRLVVEGEPFLAFPGPAAVAEATAAELRACGFSTRKAEYVLALARGIVDGALWPQEVAERPNEEAIGRLRQMAGVGRWTAQYTLLRGLGRLEVFPIDDIGAARALGRWLELEGSPSAHEVEGLLQRWGQYRGFIYFHLLGRYFIERGLLEPTSGDGGP